MRRFLGITLIIISIAIITYVWYQNSPYSGLTRTFSSYTLLSSSWERYKAQFINKDGRVIDYRNNSVTTSEGQSYALLRAVWLDDKDTFDLVWKWTKINMARSQDHLLGWQWGKEKNGKYGFLENGGNNSASDADSDSAFALILASRRWNNAQYLDDAKNILHDIWQYETGENNGKRYLLAGNWADREQDIVINPSYFAPYEWRVFAKVDPKDDWNSLLTPAYDLLKQAGQQSFIGRKGVGLPPDWISIDKNTGNFSTPRDMNLTTNNGFDAMRVPWRIALDYLWNKDPRAYAYLHTSFSFYMQQYTKTKKLAVVYSYDGMVSDATENPARYATALGYFMIVNPPVADAIYQNKIVKLYSNADNAFSENLPYYEQNWLWFGAAMYWKFLVLF